MEGLEQGAAAPKASKKLKYDDLDLQDTIMFTVVTQTTKHEEGIGYSLEDATVEKTATKAFWESLPEWGANTARKGQKQDINENSKKPTLIGYLKDGKTVKF